MNDHTLTRIALTAAVVAAAVSPHGSLGNLCAIAEELTTDA